MVSAKRKRNNDEATHNLSYKTRANNDGEITADELQERTPARRDTVRRKIDNGTPRSILKKREIVSEVTSETPKSSRKLLFATPTRSDLDPDLHGTPNTVRRADRSARRKSSRRLIESGFNENTSDVEAFEREQDLAAQILDEDEEQISQHGAAAEPVAASTIPETPIKRKRGRPKGTGKLQKLRKEQLPAPQQMPAHEEYFWQNRLGGTNTSSNTLAPQVLLDHDDYFQTMQGHRDRHEAEMQFLEHLHSRAYDQWIFELEEGFNICLYGYGSKRNIAGAFTAHLYQHLQMHSSNIGRRHAPKIVIVNGYAPGVTFKDILTTVAATYLPPHSKLPNQANLLLAHVLQHLTDHIPASPLTLVLHSIDSPSLRKSTTPAMLASLAAHPSINLICTADTPNFPLLWDVGLKAQYRFLFHDATTFAPYDVEIDVVETVNELLGRSGRRIGGRDGIGFVLRSLPENAKSLFRILVTEQLAQLYDDGTIVPTEIDEHVPVMSKRRKDVPDDTLPMKLNQGVEYRVLYHKAVEEFVCSSEVGFRTLLKEFHDHQMIESKKDSMGTERLWVPFRQEDLEGLAEDLSGDMA